MPTPRDEFFLTFRPLDTAPTDQAAGLQKMSAELAWISGYRPFDDPGLDGQALVEFQVPASIVPTMDTPDGLESLCVLACRHIHTLAVHNERQAIEDPNLSMAWDVLNRLSGSSEATTTRTVVVYHETSEKPDVLAWPWANAVMLAHLSQQADLVEKRLKLMDVKDTPPSGAGGAKLRM